MALEGEAEMIIVVWYWAVLFVAWQAKNPRIYTIIPRGIIMYMENMKD